MCRIKPSSESIGIAFLRSETAFRTEIGYRGSYRRAVRDILTCSSSFSYLARYFPATLIIIPVLRPLRSNIVFIDFIILLFFQT